MGDSGCCVECRLQRGRIGSRETSEKPNAIIQVRDGPEVVRFWIYFTETASRIWGNPVWAAPIFCYCIPNYSKIQ